MSSSDPFDRPRFFSSRLLSAEDLALEQNYFRNKQKLHNRALHGFGVVSGLKVSLQSGKVVVAPGLGIDCEGNEIIVAAEQQLALPAQSGQTVYVNVRYQEKLLAITPSGEASIIREAAEITLSAQNLNASHRHSRGRWLACGKCHALTIARLRRQSTGWRLDRAYRPPAVK